MNPLVATMKLSEHFHCVIKFLDRYKPTKLKNNLGHPLCCFLGQHTLSSFGLCLRLDTHDTPTPVSSVLIKFVVEVGLHNNIYVNMNQVLQRHNYLTYPIMHLQPRLLYKHWHNILYILNKRLVYNPYLQINDDIDIHINLAIH